MKRARKLILIANGTWTKSDHSSRFNCLCTDDTLKHVSKPLSVKNFKSELDSHLSGQPRKNRPYLQAKGWATWPLALLSSLIVSANSMTMGGICMHSISSNCQTRNRLLYRILIELVPAQKYSGSSLWISVCRDFSNVIHAWTGSREI